MATFTDIVGFEQRIFSTSGGGILSSNPGSVPTSISGRTQGFAAAHAIGSAQASSLDRNHSTRADRVWRLYLKVSSAPATLRRVWFSLATAGGRPEIQYDPADGKLGFGFVGGTFQKSASSVNDGNWHRLDFYVNLSPNPRTFDAYVDGVPITQATLAATGSTLSSRWCMGTDDTVAAAMTLHWDDCVVSDTAADYPIGPGEVIPIFAGGDGTHSFTLGDFKYGDAGTNIATSATDVYTMLDDDPWTTTRSTTDNVYAAVINTAGYVEVKPATVARGNQIADGVKAYLGYSSTSAAANTAGCIIRNSTPAVVVIWGDLPVAQGGTGGALQSYGVSANNFKSAVVTKPAAGWTKTEVEALRWRCGGQGDVTPFPTWQHLMLEAAYPTKSLLPGILTYPTPMVLY